MGISNIIGETCKNLEKLGGKSIEIVNDTTLDFDGFTEYWKQQNAPKNIIRYNGNLPASSHIIMHELTHLSMYINNTIANRGKVVYTSDDSMKLLFIKYINDWERIGTNNMMLPQAVANLINRCVFTFAYAIVNLALDLFVERLLFEKYPSLNNIQKSSLARMEQENIASDNSKFSSNLPSGLIRIGRVLNCTRSLQCQDYFGFNTVDKHSTSRGDYNLASMMYKEFKSSWDSYHPGDEYDLVIRFAELLGWGKIIYIRNE